MGIGVAMAEKEEVKEGRRLEGPHEERYLLGRPTPCADVAPSPLPTARSHWSWAATAWGRTRPCLCGWGGGEGGDGAHDAAQDGARAGWESQSVAGGMRLEQATGESSSN